MWIADLEADGLYEEASCVWCGVFKHYPTKEVREFRPHQIQDMLEFMDTTDALAMHNGIQFDWPVLEKLYGYEYKGTKFDTLIVSRLHNPRRIAPPTAPPDVRRKPHSVEAWGYRFGRYKPEHEDWSQFSEAMLHRCREDVEIQYMIYEHLLKEGEGKNWGNAYRLTFKLFELLFKQEQYGWLVDRNHMDDCIRKLTRWMDKIDRAVDPHLPMKLIIEEGKQKGEYKCVTKPFTKAGKLTVHVRNWLDNTGYTGKIRGPFSRINFRKTNLESDKEIKEFLLAEGWQPKFYNTDKEGVQTSPKLSYTDPFEGLSSGVGRLIAKRIQCRHRRSQIQGWLDAIRVDGRISSRVTGLAATGRATHGIIVNVPGSDSFFGKYMRQCFICKPGFSIVGVDAAGCQNRMLAARVNDDNFTHILLHGNKKDKTSIHFVNQRAIMDVAGVEVSYHTAKTLNYAFLFGASDTKLGKTAGGDATLGGKIREALLSVAPGFEALVHNLTEEWRSNAKKRINKYGRVEWYNGWITGLDGRPVVIESENKILVYMLQSDEAIMMAAAYCYVYKWALKRGWRYWDDWGYLTWQHDEYQCEAKDEIAQPFAKMGEQAIVKAGQLYKIACPQEGEADIGKNWYETH